MPLVPYLTGGFDYYIWWVLNGVGDVAEFEDEEDGPEQKEDLVAGEPAVLTNSDSAGPRAD